MKKLIIVCFNIILFFALYFVFKYISLLMLLSVEYSGLNLFKVANDLFIENSYLSTYQNEVYRRVENENSKNSPILILGCSYAAGVSMQPLNDDETFSFLLSKSLKENRPIYNRAMGSHSLQAMIWQFESGEIYKFIEKEPKLIIYVLINDAKRRLYMSCCPWNNSSFYSEQKDGSLKLIKNPFYYSWLAALYRELFYKKKFYNEMSEKTKFDFLHKHFLYLKNEVDKKWKNANWLILYYNDDYTDDNIKLLKNDGFDVVFLSDIVPASFFKNKIYRISDNDSHPTKEAWAVITPKIYEIISNNYNIN